MKKIILLLIVLFLILPMALGALAYIYRDPLLKTGLEIAVSRLTGFSAKVETLHFDLPSTIQVQGLKIYNPAGFHEKLFVDLPEIYISLDSDALIHQKRLHLPEVRLNLQEIFIEKNEQGVSNIGLLSKAGAEKKAAPSQPKEAVPFRLDRFELTIRRVHYADYTSLVPAGGIPGKLVSTPGAIAGRVVPGKVRESVQQVRGVLPSDMVQKKFSVDLNIEKKVFTDIEKPEALVHVIILQIMYGKTMANLKEVGVDPNELVDTVNLQSTLQSVKTSGKEVLQQTTGLVTQQAGDVVRGATGQVTNAWSKFRKSLPS